ncbi:cell surface glycoprotein MUC18-like [Polymixia lowei]
MNAVGFLHLQPTWHLLPQQRPGTALLTSPSKHVNIHRRKQAGMADYGKGTTKTGRCLTAIERNLCVLGVDMVAVMFSGNLCVLGVDMVAVMFSGNLCVLGVDMVAVMFSGNLCVLGVDMVAVMFSGNLCVLGVDMVAVMFSGNLCVLGVDMVAVMFSGNLCVLGVDMVAVMFSGNLCVLGVDMVAVMFSGNLCVLGVDMVAVMFSGNLCVLGVDMVAVMFSGNLCVLGVDMVAVMFSGNLCVLGVDMVAVMFSGNLCVLGVDMVAVMFSGNLCVLGVDMVAVMFSGNLCVLGVDMVAVMFSGNLCVLGVDMVAVMFSGNLCVLGVDMVANEPFTVNEPEEQTAGRFVPKAASQSIAIRQARSFRATGSLMSVRAKVELTMGESVEVYLGDSAQIPCRYNFTDDNKPSLVMIQWFVRAADSSSRTRIFYGDNSQQMVDEGTKYSKRIQVTSDLQGTLLTITEVQLLDEREFFCQVNGLAAGNAEGKTQLRVFAPPEAPVIEGVLTGISVTNEVPSKVASCEAQNGFPRANITWYRNGMPLTPVQGYVNVVTLVARESSGFYTVQSELQYKVVKEDKDASFSCEVSFFVPGAIRTAESKGVNITIHYPTTMVELWKELPQGLVKEGDTVELRCQGDGNPLPPFIFNREQEPDVNLESSGDVLVLPGVKRSDSGVYQCHPLDSASYTEITGEMQLTVHYLDPAVVIPKDSEVMFKEESLTATCNALSSLETSIVWYKNGKQVGRGHTLSLQDATYDTSGEYVCVVTVPSLPALRTTGSVHIIVQGAPQLNDEDREVELEEAAGRLVNLSCEAHGHPLPTISWNIVGSQSWHEVVHKANDHTAHSVVSVKVTSDISALCNASNDMGTEIKAFSIKAIPMVTSTAPFSPAEGSGVIIVVIILCILLLAILGSVLYFLHKKGKIPCGHSGKQEITKEKTTKDDIVVELKTNTKMEETVLLKAVNGDKKGPSDQYIDLQK